LQVRNPNTCWSSASDDVKIIVLGKPQKPEIHSLDKLPFCEGENITLQGPNGYSEYLWSNNETSQTISVVEQNNFWLKVRNNLGCWSDFSNEFVVIFKKTPAKPKVSSPGVINICNDEEVILSLQNDYKNYLWSNGEVTPTLRILESGNYSVKVSNCKDLYSESSDVVTVNVFSYDSMSNNNIQVKKDSLIIEKNENWQYQWYLNNQPILGAVNNYYLPRETGNYYVSIENANGCKLDFDPIEYDQKKARIIVYNNPTSNGLFRIKVLDSKISKGTVLINDPEYRPILSYSFDQIIDGHIPHVFNISGYSPGLYLIKLIVDDKILYEKLIKD
jgi:hypothetical protein